MKKVFLLLAFFVIIISCDHIDSRIKIINQTGRTVYCDWSVDGSLKFPTCTDFARYKKNSYLYNNFDTIKLGILGNWDYLLKKDPLIIFLYDSTKFENYCKGIIPIDSTYNKYYFTKKELIDNNWTIILK